MEQSALPGLLVNMSMPTWLRAHGSSRGKESNLRLTAERKELGVPEA